MAIEVRHKFVSQKADGADASLIRPSNWNDTHEIDMAGSRLIGRSAANQGPASEISLGAGLLFSGSTLAVDMEVAGGTVAEVGLFARSTPPAGWLKANGAAVSRTTYAALFAAIGTTFGSGNGSTTFNLPDLRGEFLRGWDDGRGVDSGRSFGSFQDEAIQSHSHTGTANSAGSHSHSGSTNTTGAHTHSFQNFRDGGGSEACRGRNSPGTGTTNSAGNHSHTLSINSNGAHTHSLSINSAGGPETRPRNRALLACIKF